MRKVLLSSPSHVRRVCASGDSRTAKALREAGPFLVLAAIPFVIGPFWAVSGVAAALVLRKRFRAHHPSVLPPKVG